MPGRIGKTYPRLVVPVASPAPAPRRGLSYGAIGALIALLAVLGLAGWLIFR